MTEEQLHQLLNSYVAKVINTYDKILFVESVKAAKASALRAAYITLWLSCIESLRRKFQELAVHDPQALKTMGELATQEAEKHPIDEYLLGKAKEHGLISTEVFGKLEHIYQMQRIYSRPYEDTLKLEAFVADASIVVDSILGKPTKLAVNRVTEQFHRLSRELNSLSFMLKQHGMI